MNENPRMARRLEDRIAAQAAGKSLQIVVQGKCAVCHKRSATVPATKTQAMAWFTEKSTKGFLKYEIRMLETGVHRACQKVQDQRAKEKAQKAAVKVAVLDAKEKARMQRVLARKRAQRPAAA